MRKQTTTKLVLAKQTIRQLTSRDLRAVIGGSTIVYTCDTTLAAARLDQPALGQ